MQNNFNTIIILSGGKTGSTTLYNTFKKINVNTHHSHSCCNVTRNSVNTIFELFNGSKHHNVIIPNNKTVLIINSYREPVSRMISSLFENYSFHIPGMNLNDPVQTNFEKIKNKLYEYFENKSYYEMYHPMTQFKNYNFFDIFSQQFDKNIGSSVYKFNNVTLLLLRFDKINEWQNIISKSFNWTYFRLYPVNISNSKVYAKLYRYTLANLVIPSQYIKDLLMADMDNLKFYYNEQDLQKIFQKYNIPYPESI